MGKTSFYKGSIFPGLDESKALWSYEIIYVSCIGIKSADDLLLQILNKSFQIEIFSIFLNFFKSFLTASIQFKRSLIPNKLIIVLDDFERLENPTYNEISGLAEYLKEEKNCKFIVICDSKKISSHPQFSEFKDKLIDYTYEFELDEQKTREILQSLKIPRDCIEPFIILKKRGN